MMIHVLFTLLFLTLARCAKDILEEKSFDVGQTVTLQCPRNSSETSTLLFWIRLLPGHLPEYLGGTPTFDDPASYGLTLSSIKTKQEPGSFTLSLNEANLKDTGFYYCVKVQSLTKRMIFNSATFLQIKAPDSALSVESPDLSGAVDSGDSVDPQCWVQTENAQCFKEHVVLWFRSGLDQSSPGLVYAQRNSSGQCDRRTEDQGPHKCFYTFSKSMSPSDAGTYRCAVAACGQILFGNKTKGHVKAKVKEENKCVLEKTVIVLLSVLLTISLVVLTVLICSIKRKCGRCFFVAENANDSNIRITERTRPQRDAELTYSAPKFNKKKAKVSQSRTVKAEEHVVYSDVRVRN